MSGDSIAWRWYEFGELTGADVYEMLRLRQDVFILEQECVYPELDGLDERALHLFGRDERGALVGYLRILEPGAKFEEPSIGRVVTHKSIRGTGAGRALMLEGIAKCGELYPGRPIRIAAQHRLEAFYRRLGFAPIAEPYLEEDGIMHIDMVLE